MAQRGKLEIAAELIGRAITADPADPSAHFNRGTVLAGLKRWNEAIGCYDSALSLKRDYLGALINRGTALDALKQPQDALASYERALALAPDMPALCTTKQIRCGILAGGTTRCPPMIAY